MAGTSIMVGIYTSPSPYPIEKTLQENWLLSRKIYLRKIFRR